MYRPFQMTTSICGAVSYADLNPSVFLDGFITTTENLDNLNLTMIARYEVNLCIHLTASWCMYSPCFIFLIVEFAIFWNHQAYHDWEPKDSVTLEKLQDRWTVFAMAAPREVGRLTAGKSWSSRVTKQVPISVLKARLRAPNSLLLQIAFGRHYEQHHVNKIGE